MMNSDFTHERSSAISERVLKTSKTTEARIRNAYQLLFDQFLQKGLLAKFLH